ESLFEAYQQNATDDWVWPEDKVTYANGKLPHALILAGQWTNRPDMVELGLRSLQWLIEQSTLDGVICPMGNDGWLGRPGPRAVYDQQPLDSHAMLDACIAAYRVTGEKHWVTTARRCFDWFLGRNQLKRVLYDYE